MKNINNELDDLIWKYLSGTIGEEELDSLNNLLSKKENQIYFQDAIQFNNRINKEMLPLKKNSNNSVKRFPLWKIAAVIILVIGLGGILNYLFNPFSDLQLDEPQITFESGTGETQKISGENSTLKINNNTSLTLRNDTIKLNSSSSKEISYNKLFVPKGRTSVLVLDDGTVVNINSDTEIRFPTHFSKGAVRNIYLKGEAFFSVTKTGDPFVVNASELNIEVLGTKFNVNSYENSKVIETALVEGKVRVYTNDTISSEENVLTPNMLAVYSKSAKDIHTYKDVSLSSRIAWQKGYLFFEKDAFSDIAHVLERKFNVEIEIQDEKLKNEKFTAKFEKESLEDILKSFSESYPFKFSFKTNNKITIMKK